MSIAFADLSTAEQEQQEKSNQAFVAALDLRDRIRECVLFSPEFDFTKACLCVDCASKAEKLKEFEIQIKSKKQLVMKHLSKIGDKELLCLKISIAVWRTRRMFDIFQRELKAVSVSEKSGVDEKSSSSNNLGEIHLYIQKVLEHCGLVPEEKEPYVELANDKQYDVFREIKNGDFYYGHTQGKKTASEIFNKIEGIETKKAGEKDPSISKNFIQQQIELVTNLPVQQLRSEFDELISEIYPRDVHKESNEKALEFISKTCFVMIKIMKEFFKESPKGNDHKSDGWEKFFNSLDNEVKSFEEEWKSVYAPIYTPHDRSDPKRQQTTK